MSEFSRYLGVRVTGGRQPAVFSPCPGRPDSRLTPAARLSEPTLSCDAWTRMTRSRRWPARPDRRARDRPAVGAAGLGDRARRVSARVGLAASAISGDAPGRAPGRRPAAARAGDAGTLAGASDVHRPGHRRDPPGRLAADREPGPGPLPGAGRRHAEPGEFTLRAFLSGRIDLTRAEAVLGVIEAANPAQLDAALQQLAGGLSGPILALRDHLLDVVAHLEANLDFSEEPDVDPVGRAALAAELDRSAARALRAGPAARRPRPARGLSPRRPGRAAQRRQEPAVQCPAGPRPRHRLAPGRHDPRLPDRPVRLRRADRRAGRYRRDRAGRRRRRRPGTGPPRPAGRPRRPAARLLAGRVGHPSRRRRRRSVPRSGSGPVATRREPHDAGDGSSGDRHQRGDRGGPRRAAIGDRASAPLRRGRRKPAGRDRRPMPGQHPSAPKRPCSPPRSRSWPGAATSWSPSTSGWPSRSSARSSAPWSPTTSSTGSSADSASASRRAVVGSQWPVGSRQ